MFVNSINPTLFRLGMFEVRYYGLIYALGFVIAYFFLKYFIKTGKISLDVKRLDDLILYLLIGIVGGARFFLFVFYYPQTFVTDPLSILMVWQGGLSFHGGLIGAVVAIYLFSRRHKIGFWELLDALAVPAALGLAFGRIANFTNSELVGPVTDVWWCVQFSAVDELCRHPYQIYAALSHFLLFGIVLYIYLRQKKVGTSFWSFVLFYGVFRVLTDFWRVEDRFFGLSIGQYLSIVMVVIGGIYLLSLSWRQSHT